MIQVASGVIFTYPLKQDHLTEHTADGGLGGRPPKGLGRAEEGDCTSCKRQTKKGGNYRARKFIL